MKDITTITKGVIMHQVNCQDVMGSGVAKALYTKYPQVKEEFHKLAQTYDTPQKRYGMFQPIQINENLIILSIKISAPSVNVQQIINFFVHKLSSFRIK